MNQQDEALQLLWAEKEKGAAELTEANARVQQLEQQLKGEHIVPIAPTSATDQNVLLA